MSNCSYPHKHVILDEASLKAAISHDYVCAEYRNSYRNGDNFIGSDCLPVDCDNDHTEAPAGWKTPEDVMEAFPGVTFAIHYSRFNMREKNGKPARPKFHVLFPIDYVTDAALYSDMKKLVNSIFPYFDTKALDAARFFFGTSAADVAIYPGRMTLTEFLEEDAFDDDMPDGQYDGKDYRMTDDEQELKEIERFFRSGWFGVLTKVDPDLLITNLRKEKKKYDY